MKETHLMAQDGAVRPRELSCFEAVGDAKLFLALAENGLLQIPVPRKSINGK